MGVLETPKTVRLEQHHKTQCLTEGGREGGREGGTFYLSDQVEACVARLREGGRDRGALSHILWNVVFTFQREYHQSVCESLVLINTQKYTNEVYRGITSSSGTRRRVATTRVPPRLTRPATPDGAYPHLLAPRLFGAHDTSHVLATRLFGAHDTRTGRPHFGATTGGYCTIGLTRSLLSTLTMDT
jgi:hypothetical protein